MIDIYDDYDDNYDDCAECAARGDDMIMNRDGELECRCSRCSVNRMDDEEEET